MADLAIGISKMAIQLLADKVKSAMKEEAEQWQIVQRDLVFITGEFQMMESFLDMARREDVVNDVVRTWVRQVRELFYDVEDCIEFILHLDTSKRSCWLRLLRSFSCSCRIEESALPVDEAVKEIKLLKARVEDVSQRQLRYKFIADSASNSLTQQQLVSGSAIGTPGFDILVEARDTAARCRGVVDLAKLVTGKSNDLRVISVWGTDDLGMMSIMRNMYDDSRIYDNFRCRAWVKVTHPVNPPELIRSLVVQFFANSYTEQGATACIYSQPWLCRLKLKKKIDALSWTETSAGEIVQEFVKLIGTHRYLIILEDLSTVVQWDAIRPYLLNRNNGSRIIVSTPHHEIARLCTGKPYRVLELQRFSYNQSICAFFNEGFEDTLPTQESVLVGRDSEVEKIFNLIMIEDRPYTDKPHVVSVWGLPGSGRTAVVTKCLQSLKPGFYGCWTVNMHSQPYNLMGFCQSLLSGFPSESLQADNPIEQCRELLHTVRVLVVIDEVRSKEQWDLIKAAELISAKSKSCIIVITTEETVAMHCAGEVDLVCSIRCLQPMAAFDLFQQEYQKRSSQNDRNSFEGHAFHRERNSFAEIACDYIFKPRQDELAFQNSEEVFQNNGNTSQEQAVAYQSPENTVEEQALQNNGNSSGKQALQNGNSFEEPAVQNNESSCSSGNKIKELPFQYNGNPVKQQAFQRDGNWFEGQTSQSNEKSFEEQSAQLNSGNLFEEHKFMNNGISSFEEVFWSSFETNKQEEHALENKGTTSEEPAFQNSEILFEGPALENSENHEELTFENSEDIFEVQSFPNTTTLLQEKEVRIEINKTRHLSVSRDDPNVKAILSRSGGFPQLIVALARYLATQHISNAGTRDWHCQRLIGNFMQELQTNPEFYSLRSLLSWMHSYISFSPPSLIRCMYYLLIFPREVTFQRRRLVRRWIAEGYDKGTESNSLDGSANDIFDKLTSQCVMQQAKPAGVETRSRYEVNGFFHEYMISRSRPDAERIFFPLEVSVLHEGHRRVMNTHGVVGQHLAIWRSWERNRVVFESLDFSGLRSLTVIGRWEPFLISDKMRVLRVLDLEDACEVTDDDLERIVKVLTRLKFLSLRGCRKITRVPDYLGGLRQLQTLDIRGTSVASLRFSITKLRKLQCLRAGTTDDHTTSSRSPASTTAAPSLTTPSTSGPRAATLESRFQLLELWRRRNQWLPAGSPNNAGVVVPGGIGQMVALQTLGVIDVNVSNGRHILKELKNLTQLRKLGVSGVKRENCKELCSVISCHAYLESLSVWFDFDNKSKNRAGCLDSISSPPVKLRSLKLYGLVDNKLPTWIEQVTNLCKLKLQIAMIPQNEIDEVLGSLGKLRTLCLDCFEAGELKFTRDFGALQLLEIGINSRWQAVTFHEGAMHKLEVLNLTCHNVPATLRFSGLEHLRKLKEVSLSGSYDDALKEWLHRQFYEHPRETKPVLTVEPRSS